MYMPCLHVCCQCGVLLYFAKSIFKIDSTGWVLHLILFDQVAVNVLLSLSLKLHYDPLIFPFIHLSIPALYQWVHGQLGLGERQYTVNRLLLCYSSDAGRQSGKHTHTRMHTYIFYWLRITFLNNLTYSLDYVEEISIQWEQINGMWKSPEQEPDMLLSDCIIMPSQRHYHGQIKVSLKIICVF